LDLLITNKVFRDNVLKNIDDRYNAMADWIRKHYKQEEPTTPTLTQGPYATGELGDNQQLQ
jgi:hypothetical protein